MIQRILAVSTDRDWLAELEGHVRSARPGMALDATSSPRAAQARLAGGTYDLLLVDWRLPGNGARDLVASQAGRVPALAVVPPDVPSAGSEALAAGVVDYVPGDGATAGGIVHAITSAHAVHRLRRELDQLKERESQLQALSTHLRSAREADRAWAERRIHDELGQVLSALKMEAVWLQRHLPPDRDDLAERVAALVDLVGDMVSTTQMLCTELRPRILDDLGIGPALEWLGAEFARRTGLACPVEIEPQDLALDRERATALFRIAQEALQNVERHAGATNARVGLVWQDDRVTLTVTDDGRGIGPDEAEGPNAFGLLEIRARAAALGGSTVVGAVSPAGTRLTAVLPLAPHSCRNG